MLHTPHFLPVGCMRKICVFAPCERLTRAPRFEPRSLPCISCEIRNIRNPRWRNIPDGGPPVTPPTSYPSGDNKTDDVWSAERRERLTTGSVEHRTAAAPQPTGEPDRSAIGATTRG